MIIAREVIQPLTLKEMGVTLFIAALLALLLYPLDAILSPTVSFIVFIGMAVGALNLAVYLLNKFGVAFLTFSFLGVLAFPLALVGVAGWTQLLVLFIAGLIFELLFITLKLEMHNIPLEIVIGTALSLSSIPLSVGMLLSPQLVLDFHVALLNMMALASLAALISSVTTFLLWYRLKEAKRVIELQAYLRA